MRIVITGGSRGIGRILTESLLQDHEIIVLSKTKKSTEKIKKELKVKAYTTDVSDYDDVKKTFKKIGKIDALINCAGVLGPVGGLWDNNIKDWAKTIQINLIGTVNCAKAAMPNLRKSHGKIINLSGGGSAYPRLYHSAYASSKAAVVRFTECLAKDLIEDGLEVDVNVIAPGAHKTDMWGGEKHDKEPSEWADPRLLVKLVNFLLSEKSDGITGRFIHIKDDYEKLEKTEDSDHLTLRRIDGFKFGKI